MEAKFGSSLGLRPGIEADELAEALRVAQPIVQTRTSRIVTSLIAGDPLSGDEVEELVSVAANNRSSYLTQSRLAAWALGRLQLPANCRAEVARRIERGLKPSPLSDLAATWEICFWTTMVGTLLGTIILFGLEQEPAATITTTAFSVAPKLLPFTAFHAFTSISSRRHGTVRNVLRALGRLGSVDSIPALARAYWDGPLSWSPKLKKEHREITAESLIELLGVVSGDVLSPEPQHLCSNLLKLTHATDNALVEAAIKALGVVGDRRAMDRVRECAAKHPSLNVRAAAETALPAIEERARRKAQQQELLRPSLVSPGELLRPLEGPGANDLDSLLRPIDQEPHNTADQKVTHG